MPPKSASTVKASPSAAQVIPQPDFIQSINADYKSQIAHVFLLHGNIYDYCDSSGKDQTIKQVFVSAYDDNFQKEAIGTDSGPTGITEAGSDTNKPTRLLVTYNISQGLEYPSDASYAMMKDFLTARMGGADKVTDQFMRPKGVGKLIEFMNIWFEFSKQLRKTNNAAKKQGKSVQKELAITWIISDADAVFPTGSMSQIGPDRVPIVAIRQWAQDGWIGVTNRIILMCRHASDMHDSIRSEISAVHLIRRPNLEDRRTYIKGFSAMIEARTKANGPLTVGKNSNVTKVDWAPDFNVDACAIQSAGMNLRQLKDIILVSWMTQVPIGYDSVRSRKQRALQDEYQGMIDFKEPEFGFEEVGGHDSFKRFCKQQIIMPLQTGDKRTCARGALLCGPPGTGKSILAWALAKEAKMNYLIVDLSKVFGGLVGETEANMRKLLEAIEAAAPCIVFIDELDSVLSAGRTSSGDSGTSGRVFNSFMTFMSDPSRAGKIVVLAATNRPDLLDAALIRAGRFDAKIAILPPARGDQSGRKAILKALTTKLKVQFSSELIPTMKNEEDGLGRLLEDTKRVWTGAEMEVVLKKAISTAAFSDRKDQEGNKDYTVTLEDWNHAMDVIIPNTNEVEFQTKLALLYVDDLDFVSEGWRAMAIDKDSLRRDLGINRTDQLIEE
jgi:ATP-dependent 26S proteasome regulatory subunit